MNDKDSIDDDDSLGLTEEELKMCSCFQEAEKFKNEFESMQHQHKLLLHRLEQSERTEKLLQAEMKS